jgi:hypothetical protein
MIYLETLNPTKRLRGRYACETNCGWKISVTGDRLDEVMDFINRQIRAHATIHQPLDDNRKPTKELE